MLEVIQGDITKLNVDAIVNAANKSLLGGGGVDGAIHRAAGQGLLEECRTLNGCETGQAKVTGAHQLPCKYIIHTVGPVWKGGQNNEEGLLRNCYVNCMQLADKKNVVSIAFPNISTGVYGFPKQKAAEIAIAAVQQELDKSINVKQVTFVTFDEENYNLYTALLQQ